MNHKSILVASLLLIGASLSASAQIIITSTYLGNLGQMPGSPTDYSFLGNPAQFPTIINYGGGGSPNMGVRTDFTLSPVVDEAFGGNSGYSSIKNPLGVTTQTGILFGRDGSTNQSVLTLTLGTGSATFNYKDFNLYVMYGNYIGNADTFISVKDVTAGTPLYEEAVVDTNTNPATDHSLAAFEELNITGASAGDELIIGATAGAGGLNYLGGVSLESVATPEPSIWAMLLGGVSFLMFVSRCRRNCSRGIGT